MAAYIRVFFERSNGRAVIDSGSGTPRIEVQNVELTGVFHTEHSPSPQDRPRFWISGNNCWIKVIADVAYVVGEK